MTDSQSPISEVVGGAYPPAIASGDGRLRRNWIVRTASVLPSEADLVELQRIVETEMFNSIRQAYETVATAEALAAVRPSIELLRLDDNHLIVRIEFAAPDKTVGDAAAISQYGALQALDRRLGFDELQGLPCKYWRLLRGG